MASRNNQLSLRGFTIVEVMVAVMVLSVGLVGGLTIINSNLRQISSQEEKIIAANLAAEGIELVRNIRDTNWRTAGNDWDQGIDGVGGGPNLKEFVKFFCGNGNLEYLTQGNGPNPSGAPPHSEKEYIDECASNSNTGKNCKVFIYTNGPSKKCYGDDFSDAGNPYSGYNGVVLPGFYRLIHIDDNGDPDSNKVSVTVRWSEGGQNRYLTASEVLYNWK